MNPKQSLLVLILASIALTACTAKANPGSIELKPGSYPVASAEYEIPDDDYELVLKDHGEYDIAFQDLYVVMDPSRQTSMLEITPDYRNILYINHPRELGREKEKKTKKTAKSKPAVSSSSSPAPPSSTPAKTDKKEEKK
ncbi:MULTISPECIES: hypothetical protein [Paenibacillus]|uniref:hypothetical protein n=1 Tax=Paenibacillus TaxID=44249 RepID=UPI0022B905ED|nr:hypothetical protein [Paenibacillus caseinilyticus]MCZ8522439.1 hypothetical protein [Paenibacillus caseinilyticus]